ncbi:RNA-directed DNA polymerase, eukaryota, partial [Tanacetum coccineum]
VGGNMSLVKSWDETVHKLTKILSKWKLKTLSIGGRLTLLKSVLGSTPIYNMSIFKVPKTVLNKMENLRRNFFNGIQEGDRKITWVKWHTVLAAKKFGGLGVSSFFALNRGLLAKWVWRFLSQDNSLWCQLMSVIHGSSITDLSTTYPSTWNSIIKEFNYLKVQGVDVFYHYKIRIDTVKDISVACKLQSPLVSSFHCNVRGGIEEQQLEHLVALLDFVILSNSNDRWVSDLNGDGVFRVKDVRNLLDEFFLPRADVPTRWVKNIPIKVNIFAWKLALDRLPTRANLVQRNVVTESQSCPLCDAILEDTSHLFFNCSLARDVTRLLCRWWNLGVQTFSSYAEWLVWFNSVRLASNLKANVMLTKKALSTFLEEELTDDNQQEPVVVTTNKEENGNNPVSGDDVHNEMKNDQPESERIKVATGIGNDERRFVPVDQQHANSLKLPPQQNGKHKVFRTEVSYRNIFCDDER